MPICHDVLLSDVLDWQNLVTLSVLGIELHWCILQHDPVPVFFLSQFVNELMLHVDNLKTFSNFHRETSHDSSLECFNFIYFTVEHSLKPSMKYHNH